MLFACSPMCSATIMQRAVQGMRSASLSWGGFPGRNVLRPHQVHVFYRRLLLLFPFLAGPPVVATPSGTGSTHRR